MADLTDVYIALDYPLSEDHRLGWGKINSYLDILQHDNPFKKLCIIKRDHNLGAFKNDIKTLEEYIIPFYDRWIFSEDDNEFSPNFLEYMNCCLDHFDVDKKALAVCGYNWPQYSIKSNGNNWYRQDVFFSAWGLGMWKDRWIECHQKLRSENYFKKQLESPQSLWRIWRTGSHNTHLFLNYTMTDRYIYHVYDELWAAFMHLENRYVIMPIISKVKNYGHDGSGLHCDRISSYINVFLDNEKHFSLQGKDLYFRHNRRAIVNKNYGLRQVPKWLWQRYTGRWVNPFLEEWKEDYTINVNGERL